MNATRGNQKSISIALTPEIEKIVLDWGNKPVEDDQFVFPILHAGLTPEKELALIQQATKNINDHMKNICKKLGIEKNVTTYTARHSFSTILKRSGASTEFISESLGHTNLNTTERYLDSFDDDQKQHWAKALTNFKNGN